MSARPSIVSSMSDDWSSYEFGSNDSVNSQFAQTAEHNAHASCQHLPGVDCLDFSLDDYFAEAGLLNGWPTPESLSSPPLPSPSLSTESQESPFIEMGQSVSNREKRKAQNRAAQRAFRERHQKRIKDFEIEVERLTAAVGSLQKDKTALQKNNTKMMIDLAKARDIIAALRIVCYSEKPGCRSVPNNGATA
ncbi:DNA-binding transcription factor yap1 [Elasticomyces elasticus]|nr:DNA-binding transcription factor yap1 [Elasticomyces elasticus]